MAMLKKVPLTAAQNLQGAGTASKVAFKMAQTSVVPMWLGELN